MADPMSIGSMLALASKGGGSTKVNTSQSSSNAAVASINSAISNILGQGGDTSTGGLTTSQTSSARSYTDSLMSEPSYDAMKPTLAGAVTGTNLVTGKTLGLGLALVAGVAALMWFLGKRK